MVILYIVISYIKQTRHSKIKCNRFFDALLVLTPLAVFFDGFTAWSVNNADIVPEFVNKGAHLLFFIFMDLTVIATSLYIFGQLLGFSRKRRAILLGIPGLISLIIVIAGIGGLEYIDGVTTRYSMGLSVYACYGTVVFYYGLILLFVISRRHFLTNDKVMGTLSFIIIAGVILVTQIIFPEVLLTSLFPTILMLGIYIDFEDPAIKKLTMHKDDMVDGFATMVESRDNNTGGHIKRTKAYVNLMLKKMSEDRYYR